MRNVLVVTLSIGALATACGHHGAAGRLGWVEVQDRAAGVVSVSVFRGRRVWFVNAYLGGDVSAHDPTLEAIVRTIRFNR